MNGEILIVDEHTGRMLPGRRYNEGMHQAIEAKEGVEIQNENQTLATITLQNYFRMYDKLSGMTGTAQTEAAELNAIYKLGVHTDPDQHADDPRRPGRPRLPHRGGEVQRRRRRHRRAAQAPASRFWSAPSRSRRASTSPSSCAATASGTRSSTPSSTRGRPRSSPRPGRKGAVTVATNMAGRGTDIMLGGNPEFRAVAALKARGLDPEETPEEYEAGLGRGAGRPPRRQVATEHDEVVELGGLYVLGTERHESRRIDNQLRGRSGRQGDPGESRFYLSLEDHLMRLFNAAMVDRFMTTAGHGGRGPRSSPRWSRGRSRARRARSRAQNYEIRKNVLKYDDVLNRQRQVIYDERRRVLEGEDMDEQIRLFVNDVIEGYVDSATAEGYAGGLGPRAALDRAAHALPRLDHHRRAGRRGGGGRNSITAGAAARRPSPPTRTTPTTRARRRSAPR